MKEGCIPAQQLFRFAIKSVLATPKLIGFNREMMNVMRVASLLAKQSHAFGFSCARNADVFAQ